MCGIIGRVSCTRFSAADILENLRTLEYRGYDSFGYATADVVRKQKGRIVIVDDDKNLNTSCAIAHTRWATHGGVTKENAHPHSVGKVTLVHNGIIENYQDIAQGSFVSQTDSERLAAAIDAELAHNAPLEAIRLALARANGTWALAMLIAGEEGLFVARTKAPLLIGKLDEGFIVSSDARGLSDVQELVVVEDGTIAHLKQTDIVAIDASGAQQQLLWENNLVEKQELRDKGYAMEHEILQTTDVIASMAQRKEQQTAASDLTIIGCGSSLNAALVAREIAAVSVDVQLASEARIRTAAILAVSQSGETADVLDAVERSGCAQVVALVNTPHSTLTRMARSTVLLGAGEERCVAATKSFTAQVIALCALLGKDVCAQALAGAQDAINDRESIRAIARDLQHAEHLFIIARSNHEGLAKEFALKLKEICYLHAEAVPALELKHGTLALITPQTPVLVLGDAADARLSSTMHEISARGGNVVPWYLGDDARSYFRAIVAAQLLTFEIGLLRGLPIDMPRNLAKSVTVF